MKTVNIKLIPIKTEKTYKLAKRDNVYTFKGPISLTKDDVKRYIKSAYGFEVTWIKMVKIPGKSKTDYKTRLKFKTKPYKKFYIKIKEGSFDAFK